ncbi:MAG: DNA/RNA non-specific endonuclease [Clostridia bacterium]|nr:DNA/RNA non-specific endonuclease [Clostridia bacterium]
MRTIAGFLFALMLLAGCSQASIPDTSTSTARATETAATEASITAEPTQEPIYKLNISDIPAYTGQPYVELNNNEPSFAESELTTEPFECYSPLDSLGRCGTAYANVCRAIMPTEERGKIGMVKPTGWHTAKYDFVDGQYLYNRCHLIGYQLSAENANERNLITGTRYLNIQGMLPFENMTADYVRETNNHVLYRVTPIFEKNDLLALGVQMEALSVEDNGDGIKFNVFCYNVQPGVVIDYATGDNRSDGSMAVKAEPTEDNSANYETAATTYILNTNTKKFHIPSCSSVKKMKDKNKREFTGSRDNVISQGFQPCQRCCP